MRRDPNWFKINWELSVIRLIGLKLEGPAHTVGMTDPNPEIITVGLWQAWRLKDFFKLPVFQPPGFLGINFMMR